MSWCSTVWSLQCALHPLTTSVYTIVTQEPVHCWEWAYSVTWTYSKLQGSSQEKRKSSNNFTAISALHVSTLPTLLVRFYYLHQSQQKNVCQFQFKIFNIMSEMSGVSFLISFPLCGFWPGSSLNSGIEKI